MKALNKIYILLTLLILGNFSQHIYAQGQQANSTKKERNHITKGNNYYHEGKYQDALKEYMAAAKENPSSVVARYNEGLTQIMIGSNPNDTTELARVMLGAGKKLMGDVANMGASRPELAALANYNLGNVAFNAQEYKEAVNYYKRSLRLNPNDENARRNLRITQLKIQDDQQDQDQDQNQEEEQEQKDRQDQQDKDQNQDQNQDQQDQQDQQNQQPQSNLNQQAAEQIMNAIENKENMTRARVSSENAEKSRQRNRNRRNW